MGCSSEIIGKSAIKGQVDDPCRWFRPWTENYEMKPWNNQIHHKVFVYVYFRFKSESKDNCLALTSVYITRFKVFQHIVDHFVDKLSLTRRTRSLVLPCQIAFVLLTFSTFQRLFHEWLKPIPGMFVLIWMHFSWWFQIWAWNSKTLTFLTNVWHFGLSSAHVLPHGKY